MADIRIPQTYAEWSVLLDAFREGTDDDAVIPAMHQGTIVWQGGVAQRFTDRFTEALSHRTNVAKDRFEQQIRRDGSERNVVAAIMTLRRTLARLEQAADLPAVPEEVRRSYCRIVRQYANSIQKSLEESAARDRTGRQSVLLRNNCVNAY